jgi:hypothetical protein
MQEYRHKWVLRGTNRLGKRGVINVRDTREALERLEISWRGSPDILTDLEIVAPTA